MAALAALINLFGRVIVLLIQLAARVVFGLARALATVIAALWGSRRRRPPPRRHHHGQRRRRYRRA